jgi:hypothetical protein
MRATLLAALASPEPVESAFRRRISVPDAFATLDGERDSWGTVPGWDRRTPGGILRRIAGQVTHSLDRWR